MSATATTLGESCVRSDLGVFIKGSHVCVCVFCKRDLWETREVLNNKYGERNKTAIN